MLKISCAVCGRIFSADVEHIGKRLRCSGCGNEVPIQGSERQQGTAPTIRTSEIPRAVPIKRQRTKPPAYRLGQFLRRKMLLVSLACTLAFALSLTGYLVWHGNQSQKAGIGQLPTEPPPNSPPVEDPPSPPSSEPPTVASTPPGISPPTGTNLIPEAAHSGKGELVAVNGSNFDAVLVVVRTNTHRPVREVAIRAQGTATLRHLSQGRYSIYFCNSGCFEFGNDVWYSETQTEDGTQYSQYTITLTPVPNGNVNSKPISKEEFEMATGVTL
jgi:hypothetical protein